ncbi:MAG: hypothetical protein KBD37_07550 [Burkholderiales bacterium]|nr:hypothetical protein [Burkholderiales bacterium]
MRRKYLGGALVIASTLVIAKSNDAFGQFENEYNIGYGYQTGQLIDGNQNTSNFSAQSINLEVERLFDVGIWLDGNFNMVTDYSQPNLGALNGGDGSGDPFGQDPFMFSLTFKVGYAFEVVNHKLQLIPYVLAGRTVNWATSTVLANGGENLSNDYFYTGGLGGRISYRINPTILVYADELYAYNWDNSGAIKSIQSNPDLYGKSYAATNYTFTSTLGAKFNVYRDLQLGVSGFWNNYQPQSNISGIIYTPTNTFGGMVSAGLTY